MPALDPLFGVHPQALEFQRQRMEVLASNIANADTPGYKARDLDFAKALAAASQPAPEAPALTHPQHLALSSNAVLDAARVYRLPVQPSVDGNTVELHVEQAQFADAALHYKASLSFIDGRLKSLMTAITGQ